MERSNGRREAVRAVRVLAVVLVVGASVGGSVWVLVATVSLLTRDVGALVTADRLPTREQLAAGVSLLDVVASNEARIVGVARQQLPAWIEELAPLGSGKIVNIVGASLLARGVFHGERRAIVGGLTLLEGNLIIGEVVNASKDAFGRVRPNHPGPGRWFAEGDSFPSSHAAHAFLIASVVDATLEDPGLSRIAYSLASGVALQRLHEGVHYPTDVIAGGALGWWVGHRLSVAHGLAAGAKDAIVW
jgi:membrane-associated phospholipid phosphatase